MKKLFYLGIAGISLFEILNVYFIMPMPGSQRMHSIDVAYFLYSYRWYFRILFGLLIAAGTINVFQSKHKWIPVLGFLVAFVIIYLFNFVMVADHMFRQPFQLSFQSKDKNKLNDSSLVVCVTK